MRQLRLKGAVLCALACNAEACQDRRAKRELVALFRRQHLLRKSMLSLVYNRKLSMSKHAYSKKFSVFTAWKSLTKENRLLNKYLKECNFQSKPKSVY